MVFTAPQTFAFAKGAGIFGEAGPEAIMPLTRALMVHWACVWSIPGISLLPAGAPSSIRISVFLVTVMWRLSRRCRMRHARVHWTGEAGKARVTAGLPDPRAGAPFAERLINQ
jgi:hypothetical protein